MKKTAVTALCVLSVAILWLGCFRSEAGQLVGHSAGELSLEPVAASAEFADARIPPSDPISKTITASGTTPPAGSTQLDMTGPRVPFQDAGIFDHLVAETSSEEAMAPQKSDTADALAARTR